MKAIPFVIAAAVVGAAWYLWNQIQLWRCAMTGSTEVYPGSVVSPSMQCAAKLGLYGLSYDSSTGAIGKGSLEGLGFTETTPYVPGQYTGNGNGNGEEYGEYEGAFPGIRGFFLPWEEHDMSMDEWCETDLPSFAQRFAYCDLSTWV